MWIDRIVELVPRERLVAVKNVSLSDEVVHDHFEAGDPAGEPATPVFPASLIIEGAAQSAGILVGHAESFAQKVILAKLGRVELERDVTPGMTLRYTATLQRLDGAGAAASAVIEAMDHAGDGGFEPIGRIELVFSHVDQNMAGVAFPEHNFVFSESFRTLLRTSGVEEDF